LRVPKARLVTRACGPEWRSPRRDAGGRPGTVHLVPDGAVTPCPHLSCHEQARIREWFALESTDGWIEHVELSCPAGHGFSMPVDMLDRYRKSAPDH